MLPVQLMKDLKVVLENPVARTSKEKKQLIRNHLKLVAKDKSETESPAKVRQVERSSHFHDLFKTKSSSSDHINQAAISDLIKGKIEKEHFLHGKIITPCLVVSGNHVITLTLI